MINIKLSHILSSEPIFVPSITITGPMFRYAHIAWVKTADGGDYDILFDQRGEPLVDKGLMERVAKYYGKTFEAVLFDNRAAYAQVNKMPAKASHTQAAQYLDKGSNPSYSQNTRHK